MPLLRRGRDRFVFERGPVRWRIFSIVLGILVALSLPRPVLRNRRRRYRLGELFFLRSTRIYEGWVVVGSAALIVTMVGAVFFYGFGLIFTPVKEEFGWSNAQVSLAFALRTETGGLAAPLVGLIADRRGARPVLLTGVALMALGLVLMSLMENLWQFYAAMIVIAFGTSAAGGQVGMLATATWFERRRSRAMSIMTTGGGFAGLLVIGVAALVDAFGWRSALRYMAIIVAGIGVPLGLIVRNRPSAHPQPMDGLSDARLAESPGMGARMAQWGVPVRAALRSRSYIFLALSNVGFGFGTTALIVHQVPYLEDRGISSTTAGATVAAFALISVLGRLGFGYLGDKYDKPKILAVTIALTGAGMPIFAYAETLWVAMLGLIVIAPGFGGAIPLRPALIADNFGTRYFGALNGLMFTAYTFGAFFGPLVVGILVDQTDSYTAGWLACAVVTAGSAPLALWATPPTALIARFREPVTA